MELSQVQADRGTGTLRSEETQQPDAAPPGERTHAHGHTRMHTDTHGRTRTHTDTHNTHGHTRTHTDTHAGGQHASHTDTRTHAHFHTHARAHVHTSMHTQGESTSPTRTHGHTHPRTHMHTHATHTHTWGQCTSHMGTHAHGPGKRRQSPCGVGCSGDTWRRPGPGLSVSSPLSVLQRARRRASSRDVCSQTAARPPPAAALLRPEPRGTPRDSGCSSGAVRPARTHWAWSLAEENLSIINTHRGERSRWPGEGSGQGWDPNTPPAPHCGFSGAPMPALRSSPPGFVQCLLLLERSFLLTCSPGKLFRALTSHPRALPGPSPEGLDERGPTLGGSCPFLAGTSLAVPGTPHCRRLKTVGPQTGEEG